MRRPIRSEITISQARQAIENGSRLGGLEPADSAQLGRWDHTIESARSREARSEIEVIKFIYNYVANDINSILGKIGNLDIAGNEYDHYERLENDAEHFNAWSFVQQYIVDVEAAKDIYVVMNRSGRNRALGDTLHGMASQMSDMASQLSWASDSAISSSSAYVEIDEAPTSNPYITEEEISRFINAGSGLV